MINLNKEYNVEEVYDAIEAGLEAFEKLISCTCKFPKFDLDEDLNAVYRREDHAIVKDFIKWGFEFVNSYQNGENPELVENDGVEETLGVAESANTELSQLKSEFQEDTSIAIAAQDIPINDKDKDRIRKTFVDKTPLRTPAMLDTTAGAEMEQQISQGGKRNRKKSKRSKERRQERLLKFHEKLVLTSGLPPSRLMETWGNVRRNLSGEFRELGGDTDSSPGLIPAASFSAVPIPTVPIPTVPIPTVPIPTIPIPAAPVPTAVPSQAAVGLLQGQCQPQVHYNGTTSSSFSSPMLGSISTPGLGGCGWTSSEWPEARPVISYSWIDNSISPGPGSTYGSTSDFIQSPTLSPISESRLGWNDVTMMCQPNPHAAGKPAV
jgi:hypothetical protein